MPKEILTIQVGSFSNFVGTHFWNSSDDLFSTQDSRVLYRNGIENYAPRLVSIDLKGSICPILQDDKKNQQIQWAGKVLRVEKQKAENAFLDNLNAQEPQDGRFGKELEEMVIWPSDFNKLYYHSKTMMPVHTNFGVTSLINFNQGTEVWENEEWRSALMDDHVRFFMEECDSPQGFQLLSDGDNGFSGLTSELLLKLQDDYSKKSIFTVSVGMDSLEDDHLKSYNRSLAVHHFSQGSSLYIPLNIPDIESIKSAAWSKYLCTNTSSMYHWSGYLSAVFQTMFMPVHFPLNGRFMSLMEMSSIFKKNNDSPLAALNVMMPFPIWSADSGLIQDTLKVLRPGEYQSQSLNLTTRRPFDKALDSFGQMGVLRGATDLINSITLESNCSHRYKSESDIQNLLDNYLQSFGGSAKSVVVNDPFLVGQSYPDICSSLSRNGTIPFNQEEIEETTQFAVMTRLHASSDLYDFLMDHSQVLKSHSKSFNNILEAEELRDWTEDLLDLAQQYI